MQPGGTEGFTGFKAHVLRHRDAIKRCAVASPGTTEVGGNRPGPELLLNIKDTLSINGWELGNTELSSDSLVKLSISVIVSIRQVAGIEDNDRLVGHPR